MKHLIIIGARGFAREAYHMALRTKDYQNGVYDIKGFWMINLTVFMD